MNNLSIAVEQMKTTCESFHKKKNPENRVVITLDILGYIGCVVLLLYCAYRWNHNFFDPYLQDDDVRGSMFLYWGLHGNLFKGDYLARAISLYTPWLHTFMYYLLTFPFNFLLVTKIVQILTILWGAFHLFRIGQRRSGGMGGLFGLYLALHSYALLLRSSGGLPRGFALPVILMTVDGIDRNSGRQSALGAILGFAIYPTGGMLALGTYAIWRLAQCISGQLTFRKGVLQTVLLTLVCFLCTIPTLLKGKKLGKAYSLSQVRRMPECGIGGRVALVPLPTISAEISNNFFMYLRREVSSDSPLPFLEKITKKSNNAPLFIFIGFAFFFHLFHLTKKRLSRIPYASMYLAIATVIIFELACLFAFRLYAPQGIFNCSMPIIILYLLASTYTEIGYKRGKGIIPRVSSFVIMLLFMSFFGIAFKGPIGFKNVHDQKELFQLLQTLPEDALFAGHPMKVNNIPLWGKRRILINRESSAPYFDKTWENLKERNYDMLDAYYASNIKPLLNLRKKYGVDYMLIHKEDISPNYARHNRYFAPFTRYSRDICQKPSRTLVWRKTPASSIVGMSSGFIVINLKTFLEELAVSPPRRLYDLRASAIINNVDQAVRARNHLNSFRMLAYASTRKIWE